VFVRSGVTWTQQAKLLPLDLGVGDEFGRSLALDGDTALIASPYHIQVVQKGSAYVFRRSGGIWTQLAELTPSDGTGTELFGFSVALSGPRGLIGAQGDTDREAAAGAAYMYVIPEALGRPCAGATDCESGFCVDGVCCNNVCAGGAPDDCIACGADGICGPRADGSSCNDGNLCTVSDVCSAGKCIAAITLACAPANQCHSAGTCNPATGMCSQPTLTDGTKCDDANACTLSDLCMGGACVGGSAVVCAALDECHVAGTCDAKSGVCSNPARPDGSKCRKGGRCIQGVCTKIHKK
jgi:hypothetical protein